MNAQTKKGRAIKAVRTLWTNIAVYPELEWEGGFRDGEFKMRVI